MPDASSISLDSEDTDVFSKDSLEISIEEFRRNPNNRVIVSIPSIYVNVDEADEDLSVPNLRVIEYTELCSLMLLASTIETNNVEEQFELCNKLTSMILNMDQNCKEYIDFINSVCASVKDSQIEESFENSTTDGILMDTIRMYVNSPDTGLLISAEPYPFGDVSVYSQLSPEDVLRVRELTNATDLNHMYYVLHCYEQALLFKPNRLYNNTTDIVNLVLVHILLAMKSAPLQNQCANDLKNNLMAFLVDAVIRTRLISKWKLHKCTNMMLADITNRYCKNNIMVKLCRLDTAKDRANEVYKTFYEYTQKEPKLKPLLATLSFSNYENVLNSTVHAIMNKNYYILSTGFLKSLAFSEGLAAANAFRESKVI